MPNRSRKPTDPNELAVSIIREAISEKPPEKNPAAVALGKLGGLKGGPARARNLTASRRKTIAQKAAKARWSQKGKNRT